MFDGKSPANELVKPTAVYHYESTLPVKQDVLLGIVTSVFAGSIGSGSSHLCLNSSWAPPTPCGFLTPQITGPLDGFNIRGRDLVFCLKLFMSWQGNNQCTLLCCKQIG